MRTIVILAPMQVELGPVARALGMRPDGGDHKRHTTTIGNLHVTAILAGVGPDTATRSTTTVLEELRPEHVIVAGVAGGIAPHLAVGDLVVAEEAMEHRSGRTSRSTPIGDDVATGRIITTDTILSDAQLAAEIAAGFVAVDMETAAIGVICDDAGVPWTAYRAISDRVGEGVIDESTLALVNNDGTTNLAAVARAALGSPSALRRFARMRRDGRLATTAVASAAARAVQHLAS